MAEQHTCTCDYCGRDLSNESDQRGYEGIVIGTQPFAWIPHSHGGSTVHITPLLDRDYHFCDLDCLRTWNEEPAHA